jgi:hypothetical protein
MLGYRQSGNDGKLSPVTRKELNTIVLSSFRKELNTNFSGRMKGSRTRIISYTPLTVTPPVSIILNNVDYGDNFQNQTIDEVGTFYSHNPYNYQDDFESKTINNVGTFYSHDPFNYQDGFEGKTINDTSIGTFYATNLFNYQDGFEGETINNVGTFFSHQ